MDKKLLFIFGVFPSLVFATEPVKILQFAFSEVAPYAYLDQSLLTGINIKIADQIQKLTGLKFDYKLYPHARLSNSLDLVNPDLTIGLLGTCNKFSESYEHVGRFYHITPTLYLKSGADTKDKKLRIGRMRGTCTKLLKENPQFENIVDVADLKQALIMMELGRIEGICTPATVMKYNLLQEPKFKEKLIVYKTESNLSDFEAVICRKKSLSNAVKGKLDNCIKKIKIDL